MKRTGSSTDQPNQAITRRQFLGTTLGAAAAGVLSSTLAGCGSTPVPGGGTAGTASASTGAAPAASMAEAGGPSVAAAVGGAKQTIEMWMWETEPRWKEVQAAAGLSEKFPNVEFKWTALPFDQLHQKAITALAAGVPTGVPSIIRTGMGFYRAFVNTKAILDLTDQVQAYEKDILPSVWQGALVDGKMYQVPDDTGVTLFGYREDLFEKAGLPTEPDQVADLLQTYDDLIAAGAKLEQSTGAKLFNMLPDAGVFNGLILQDSTGYFDADGNVIFDSDYHVEAANIAKRLWKSNLVTNFEQGPQMWQAYKDGMLATTFWPNWQDFVLIDNAPETKGKWRVAKLPAVKAGGKRAHSDDGVCLVIPAILPDEQKQLAIEVALYMKLTEKATVAHMKTFSGAFVSYVPGLEAMTNEPSPMLKDQKVYPLYLDTARQEQILPWYRTSVFFPNAGDAASSAMFRIFNENAAVDETLKEAADSIRQMQESRGTN